MDSILHLEIAPHHDTRLQGNNCLYFHDHLDKVVVVTALLKELSIIAARQQDEMKEKIMEVRYSVKDISEENLLIFKEYALPRPVS